MRSFITTALLAAAVIGCVAGEGINCEGSGWCASANSNVAQDLSNLLQGVDPNRWYNNGEWIGCVQSDGSFGVPDASGNVGFCAFLQNSGGDWGSVIKSLAPDIPGHGCRVCGSVPLSFPGDNNVNDGELTFNMVTMGPGTQCTEGLC
jgi:hypothetical protein